MSEGTIKMLKIINTKIKKTMNDNNVNDNTLFVIPLGNCADYGYMSNKMLNEIIQSQQENEQLQNNWNELKEYVQKELKEAEDDFAEEDFIKVLDRMQELENRKV